MLDSVRSFVPRPLYIATVALGLAAGYSVAGRNSGSSEAQIKETMRDQHLRDRREAIIVGNLEDTPKIMELNSDDREVLDRMLHDHGVRATIACSILASFNSPQLMKDYVAPLTEFYGADSKNPIVAWTLSCWRKAGGQGLVAQLASSGSRLADAAKEAQK